MGLYDVVAVNLKTRKVRMFGRGKTDRNAEAIINMAIMRRGCDEEFYTKVKTGSHHDGDNYNSAEAPP